jgi:hypothetical protein
MAEDYHLEPQQEAQEQEVERQRMRDRREHRHRRTTGELMDTDDVYRHRRAEDDVELSVPFGTFRAHGKDATLLLMFCAVMGLMGYGFYLYDDHRSTNEKKAEADHAALAKKLDEMVWILSRPEKEREKLDISMPNSLRDKVRDREQR